MKDMKTTKRVVGAKKKRSGQQDRPVIEPDAAGIDVGAREMFVAIPPDRDSEVVCFKHSPWNWKL